ncbi:MAG: MBL fold metallo-hydrolase [Chloroflexi bacterium]|nr:MAG: MBL fold metallo-hydrolase [Chloroflexota bacterium]
MLSAGARRRDRRLHDPRPRRHRASCRLHQCGQRPGSGPGRARRLGCRSHSPLSGRHQDRSLGPPGLVARHRDGGGGKPGQHVGARGPCLRRQDRRGIRDRRDRFACPAVARHGEAGRREGRPYGGQRSFVTVRVEAVADQRFGTNSYLVEDEETKDAVIIDANIEPQGMIQLVGKRGVHLKAVLLTHTDVDHIAGLPELIDALGPFAVAVHDAEKDAVMHGKPLRRQFTFNLPIVIEPESLEEGVPYRAGSLEFEVLHTPGHSPGGVTLKIGENLFTGDALFAGSIGRSDFDNSDGDALLEGIRTKLLSQPDELVVYSGHGPATTIGREKRSNPFLQ